MSGALQAAAEFPAYRARASRMAANPVASFTGTLGTRLASARYMRWISWGALIVLLTVMTAKAAGAQKNSAAPFRSGVDLVTLDVTVTDSARRLVRGLTRGDFAIFENRVPQAVALFASDDQTPVAAVVLIDRSASMVGPKIQRAQEAAAAFIRSLRSGDLVEVMAFNERAERLIPLGPDQTAAERALSGIVATGQTALFEAVFIAVRDLQAARRGKPSEYREAIVVLSDGEDNKSRPTFDDVLDAVRRSGVIVYAISLRTDAGDKTLPPLHEMSQLAYDTGGRAMAVHDLAALDRVYGDIGAELRQMYRLGYLPAAVARDGRWHSIAVLIPDSNARARTRAGYYAPLMSQSGGLP